MLFELSSDDTPDYGEGFIHISSNLNEADEDKLVEFLEQEQGVGVVGCY